MIFLKTEDEIELLRASNLLVGKTLAQPFFFTFYSPAIFSFAYAAFF